MTIVPRGHVRVQAGDVLGIHYREPVSEALPTGSGIVPYESTNDNAPLCCGMSPADLSKLLTCGRSDEELPVGTAVIESYGHRTPVRRLPALLAEVEPFK